MEWINLKTKRPNPEQKILFFANNKVCYGQYMEYQDSPEMMGYFEDLDKMSNEDWVFNIKFWMPLPEKPGD